MPRIDHHPRRFAAIIFDLDETLLTRAGAWRYVLEEAVVAVTGRRVDAAALAGEYRSRPWRHALAVVLEPGEDLVRCEALCQELFARSGMKRLLVHEGIGMALDQVRAARVEIGAISREPHTIALRQVQSTGLDRFLAVLAATPDGERWDPGARIAQCLAYLGHEAARAGYVSGDAFDLREAVRAGVTPLAAMWAGPAVGAFERLDSAASLVVIANELP